MNREGKKCKALGYIKSTFFFYLYLINYLQEHDDDLRRCLVSLAHFDTTTENDELVTLLTMETFREHMSTFWKRTKAEIHTFTFGGSTCIWWVCDCCSSQLREMAFEICSRLSKWSHICYRYDHTNNARWGVIYLAQLNQLPVEVIQQFQRGNCVVNK